MRLAAVHPSDAKLCLGLRCPMEFSGRPGLGAKLVPDATHDWELRYSFFERYMAELTYDVLNSEGQRVGRADCTIETEPLSNNSSCTVSLTRAKCEAGGLHLTFDDK